MGDEIKIEDRRFGTTNSNDATSRLDDLNEDELNAEIGESEEEYMQKSKHRVEEEKSKMILTRKEWDKNFD